MYTIRDRLIILLKFMDLKNPALEKKTEIPRTTWQNLRNKKGRVNEEQIQAITNLYPEYAYWLTTGKVIPEAGQISPEIEEERIKQNLRSPRTGTY